MADQPVPLKPEWVEWRQEMHQDWADRTQEMHERWAEERQADQQMEAGG
jgi:hypothetical protein